MKTLGLVLLCVVTALMGLGGGYYAANQKTNAPMGHAHGHAHGADDHGHDHGAEDPHAGHDHEHGEEPKKLSPQALKNLGVESKEVATQSFVQTRTVAAVVMPAPLNQLPLLTPVAGTVQHVSLVPHTVANGGTLAIRLVREAFPRPELKLTEELVRPGSETLHTAAIELRKAQAALESVRAELALVQPLTTPSAGDPATLLPRKTEFDLKNRMRVLERDVQNAREKLELHGVSGDQLKELESTGEIHLRLDGVMVRRALQHNGLWSDHSEALYGALPEALRQMPWTVAVIGELSGLGLLDARLPDWLKKEPTAAAHFIDIAGLLQAGQSLARIEEMHRAGGLAPIVELRVPVAEAAPDWDVEAVDVKPGTRVEAGQRLALLVNSREMLLRAEPSGSELPLVLNTFTNNKKVEAAPLIQNGGPLLRELTIQQVSSEATVGTPFALLALKNEAFERKAPSPFRSWQLRAGQRYLLHLPVKELSDVFVLPAEALTDEAADKVVFVRSGETFESRKVVVLYQDSERVVLDSKHSDLFPGDDVVVRGAFGLGLALKAGSGEVDPHAGHTH
jgi:hypothetical protein